MPYNESLMTNQTQFMGYVQSANTESGGLLFLLLLIVIWVVIFVGVTTRFGFTKGFSFSSFSGTILSVLLWGAGLLAIQYVWVGLFMAAIGLFLLIYDN